MNITKCIKAIDPTSVCCVEDVDGTLENAVITWENNPSNITKEMIQAKHDEINALWEVQHLRGRTYPTVTEQLDYIYHNGIDKWKTDMIDPVKAKYPKPE